MAFRRKGRQKSLPFFYTLLLLSSCERISPGRGGTPLITKKEKGNDLANDSFLSGKHLGDPAEGSLADESPVHLTRQLLSELKHAGLVAETARGAGHEVGFLPARTIENITVQSTLDAYEQGSRSIIPPPQSEEGKKFFTILTNISDLISNSKVNLLLKEIG